MTPRAANDEIRAAVTNADRAHLTAIDGGRGRDKPPPPADPDAPPPCPITPLGHLGGKFYFLDAAGQQRDLTARALGGRADLLGLFLGDDRWLRREFPKYREVTKGDAGETEKIIVDFTINRAAAHFMQACDRAGLYGDHLVFRRPGVWPGDDDSPIVHCGDRIRIGVDWCNAGVRTGSTIWAAAAPTPRPDMPCDAAVGLKLQNDLTTLFRWREPGGPVVTLGLLGTAYLAAAASWRSAGFLLGPAGCGKSTLLKVLRAACPMHWYSNDTSKAGLEQGLNGRAMACLLDETEKSGDQRGAQNLLDLVLTASGDGGTQGARGGIDGVVRKIEVVGSIIMAATAAPEMKATHLGRFALIHLEKPEQGEDYRNEHAQLVEHVREVGAQLWGRALGALARYRASLKIFREALMASQCEPREMDQLGAILAGWWILTHEGAPTPKGAAEGVGAIAGFVRTADIVAEDSNAKQLLMTLLSTAIQLDRSTAQETIADLVSRIYFGDTSAGFDDHASHGVAARALQRHGIRVVRAKDKEPNDSRGRPVPRLGDVGGLWINPGSTELRALFDGTDWSGTRWVTGLQELPHARKSPVPVKVGSLNCRPIWIRVDDLDLEDASQEVAP